MKLNNPFLIAGYHSPEYFCDREQETKTMMNALENERNITLIAPRRMGKTGLIKNVFYKLQEGKTDISTFYLDIYSTQNLSDFVQLLASTIIGELDSLSQKTLNRIGMFLKSCHPTFSFDEITGKPQVGIDIAPNKEEATLKEIFEYLHSSGKKCYIAIDEFQQIGEYPEKGVEALLRSYIQFLPNVHFIFAGSKQHVMQEMFLSAKRPFYQSTQIISIEGIEKEKYYHFAASFFAKQGRVLEEETFTTLYNEFEGHTWYIQAILNRLYGYREEKLNEKLVNQAIEEIVAESVYPYQTLLAAYSSGAIKLLKAIAKERVATAVNSGSFIAKYKLKAASSVNVALKTLINKELVYKTAEGYTVYDRFMAIWLRRQP